MIKEFVLIITATMGGNIYVAPATYHDTLQECNRKADKVKLLVETPTSNIRAQCFRTVPEVDEK